MRNPPNQMIRVGTWNVRTMWTEEKLENIKYEMNRHGLQIFNLTEARLKDNGDFISDDVRVVHSRGTSRGRGVALLLD